MNTVYPSPLHIGDVCEITGATSDLVRLASKEKSAPDFVLSRDIAARLNDRVLFPKEWLLLLPRRGYSHYVLSEQFYDSHGSMMDDERRVVPSSQQFPPEPIGLWNPRDAFLLLAGWEAIDYDQREPTAWSALSRVPPATILEWIDMLEPTGVSSYARAGLTRIATRLVPRCDSSWAWRRWNEGFSDPEFAAFAGMVLTHCERSEAILAVHEKAAESSPGLVLITEIKNVIERFPDAFTFGALTRLIGQWPSEHRAWCSASLIHEHPGSMVSDFVHSQIELLPDTFLLLTSGPMGPHKHHSESIERQFFHSQWWQWAQALACTAEWDRLEAWASLAPRHCWTILSAAALCLDIGRNYAMGSIFRQLQSLDSQCAHSSATRLAASVIRRHPDWSRMVPFIDQLVKRLK